MNFMDLDAAMPLRAELAQAARALGDKAWAETVVACWQQEMGKAYVRSWLFQLGLIAANSLGRAEEFLQAYEDFLARYDAQSKPDWHSELTDRVRAGSMIEQSARLGQDLASFGEEFKRVVTALQPETSRKILDVGCAGGAYSINLAKLGFEVLGTDHHSGIVDDARRNAATVGVAGRATFAVDEACDSKIPDGAYSRAICISVTPCLADEQAFEALVKHLDRVTRDDGRDGWNRRVILGHNRWSPSRLGALRQILAEAGDDPEQALHRLNSMQACWWMRPAHLELMKKYFSSVTPVGESVDKIDGVRVDLLLQ
jgi:SAM-dependent methyltransferase